MIKCPKCGAQYLPAEIFLPNEFLGKPKTIFKDNNGIIEDYSGNSMDTEEEYICDYCDTPFNIYATVQFKTLINEGKNFNELYVTKIPVKKQTFELSETD